MKINKKTLNEIFKVGGLTDMEYKLLERTIIKLLDGDIDMLTSVEEELLKDYNLLSE